MSRNKIKVTELLLTHYFQTVVTETTENEILSPVPQPIISATLLEPWCGTGERQRTLIRDDPEHIYAEHPNQVKTPSDCWVNESQSYSTAGSLGLCLRSCSHKQPHRAQDQEFLSRADVARPLPICKGLMNLQNCWPLVESSAAVPESCPWPAACHGAST